MRRLPKTLVLSLLVILLAITACGGGDNNDNEPNDQQPTSPTATLDAEGGGPSVDDTLFSDFDEADIPLPSEVVMKNDLTLLSSNYFVQDDRVYVMFVVRNDSNETIRNIHFNVTMIDKDRLPLENYSFSSPYNNIPPGQVIVVGNDYWMDDRWAEYYDGIAAAITADTEQLEGYNAYFDAGSQAQLITDESKVIGTATNIGSDPLIILTATFALYDENNNIIGVVSAVPSTGLDDEGYWQPGVTINFEAGITAVSGSDLAAVTDVQLVTAGYALDF
jgi:hypothetical protein